VGISETSCLTAVVAMSTPIVDAAAKVLADPTADSDRNVFTVL